MQIITDLNEWQAIRKTFPADFSIGFVPTMGNLHAGHASLFQSSKKNNKINVVSIFINPKQFDQQEDFTHYPRTLEADFNQLRDNEIDFCLLPSEKAIYADGYVYQIQETTLSQILEGKYRSGHFTGVLTIVMKLLQLVKPTNAYFGEKDYQQFLLIRDMAKAFFLDTKINSCPTLREASGLAYSSRNNRLDKNQREQAQVFAQIFHQHDKRCDQLAAELHQQGFDVEYLEEYANRRYVAVNFGKIRLIDNYPIDF